MSFVDKIFTNFLFEFRLFDILICLLLTIVFYLVFFRRRFTNLPPGPRGIPFFGYLPFINDPVEEITYLGKQYGDVFKLHLLGRDYVVLNSFDAIKEALIKQNDNFSGRSRDFNLFSELHDYNSIITQEGDKWRIFNNIFNNFFHEKAIGTPRFEVYIEDIVMQTIENINSTKGNAYDFYEILTNATYNLVSSFTFNEIHGFDDERFLIIVNSMRTYFKACPNLDMFLFGSWARFAYSILRASLLRLKRGILNKKNWTLLREAVKTLYDIMKQKISEHEKTFDETYIRDYIDYVIQFRRENKQIEITDEEFAANVNLFFIAGTETSSTTLYFAIYHLAANKYIQQKCQEDVDRVFGSERFPSYLDKELCPYLNAFISEVHRFAGIVPFSIPHVNKATTNLMGYTIPARTIILPNLYAAMKDEKYFPNPSEFNPQHFLDENGSYNANEALVPFSIGKRKCPGRGAANIEIFIILARILQNFNLVPPTNDAMAELHVFNGITRFPLPFKIRAIKR